MTYTGHTQVNIFRARRGVSISADSRNFRILEGFMDGSRPIFGHHSIRIQKSDDVE